MFFPFRRPKRKTNAFHTNRIIHDTFTGNDGVRISQRLTDSGHTWVDSSGTMECYGGKARIKTAATPNRARIPTNQSEVTVKCRLTVTATKGAGVCPRYLDSSNYIGAVVMSNQMLLFKVVTGTMTSLYDQPHAWTNDDQLAVVCKADKVSI